MLGITFVPLLRPHAGGFCSWVPELMFSLGFVDDIRILSGRCIRGKVLYYSRLTEGKDVIPRVVVNTDGLCNADTFLLQMRAINR